MKPKPPEQPERGPGGADYAHAKVKKSSVGRGGKKAWIFEPADPSPEKAPVVVFLHGWGAWWPLHYRTWIDHLVRRGNVVIYPRYQASFVTLPTRMTANAIAGIQDALAELPKDGRVHPDGDRFAVAGHSLGGVIAANVAATADDAGLPRPLAVMCVQPGDPKHAQVVSEPLGTIDMQFRGVLGDCSAIPAGTLVLVVVGDCDEVVSDTTARIIWDGIRHLPAADRDFVIVHSDDHGSPALKADHFSPIAPQKNSFVEWTGSARTDALDYYGTWKLLDGLTDAAFHGRNREYALGNTPEQRYMGTWPDGTPVKELEVLEK